MPNAHDIIVGTEQGDRRRWSNLIMEMLGEWEKGHYLPENSLCYWGDPISKVDTHRKQIKPIIYTCHNVHSVISSYTSSTLFYTVRLVSHLLLSRYINTGAHLAARAPHCGSHSHLSSCTAQPFVLYISCFLYSQFSQVRELEPVKCR